MQIESRVKFWQRSAATGARIDATVAAGRSVRFPGREKSPPPVRLERGPWNVRDSVGTERDKDRSSRVRELFMDSAGLILF